MFALFFNNLIKSSMLFLFTSLFFIWWLGPIGLWQTTLIWWGRSNLESQSDQQGSMYSCNPNHQLGCIFPGNSPGIPRERGVPSIFWGTRSPNGSRDSKVRSENNPVPWDCLRNFPHDSNLKIFHGDFFAQKSLIKGLNERSR